MLQKTYHRSFFFPKTLVIYPLAYCSSILSFFWFFSYLKKAQIWCAPPKICIGSYAFKEYTFYLDIYNTHTDINRAAVTFAKKLCPTELLGLEVGFGTLPTNLRVDAAFKYLLEMAVETTVYTKAAMELQKPAYSLQYLPNANWPTVFFQRMQHL